MSVKQWLRDLPPLVRLIIYAYGSVFVVFIVGGLAMLEPRLMCLVFPSIVVWGFIKMIVSGFQISEERRRIPWDAQ